MHIVEIASDPFIGIDVSWTSDGTDNCQIVGFLQGLPSSATRRFVSQTGRTEFTLRCLGNDGTFVQQGPLVAFWDRIATVAGLSQLAVEPRPTHVLEVFIEAAVSAPSLEIDQVEEVGIFFLFDFRGNGQVLSLPFTNSVSIVVDAKNTPALQFPRMVTNGIINTTIDTGQMTVSLPVLERSNSLAFFGPGGTTFESSTALTDLNGLTFSELNQAVLSSSVVQVGENGVSVGPTSAQQISFPNLVSSEGLSIFDNPSLQSVLLPSLASLTSLSIEGNGPGFTCAEATALYCGIANRPSAANTTLNVGGTSCSETCN